MHGESPRPGNILDSPDEPAWGRPSAVEGRARELRARTPQSCGRYWPVRTVRMGRPHSIRLVSWFFSFTYTECQKRKNLNQVSQEMFRYRTEECGKCEKRRAKDGIQAEPNEGAARSLALNVCFFDRLNRPGVRELFSCCCQCRGWFVFVGSSKMTFCLKRIPWFDKKISVYWPRG